MANTKVIRLELDGFPDDAYDVVSFRGTEGVSNLFRYTITLASRAPTQDFDALLEAKAHLILGDPATHVHGILCSIQQGYDAAWRTEAGTFTRCDVVLVPKLYRLSLTSRTRVFQELTIPDIVKQVLSDNQLSDGDDFEFRMNGRYTQREFVLQYQESDLDFIQRLMEYDGIHYHFESDDSTTKLIVGDANAAFTPIAGDSTVRLGLPDITIGEQGLGPWGYEETATRFQSRQRLVTKKVVLGDYNDEKVTVSLDVDAEIAETKASVGHNYYFGDHYEAPPEGKALVKVRTEEILSRKRVYMGAGTVRRFFAGGLFSLTGVDGIDAGLAQEYLVTETTSQGSQPVEFSQSAKEYNYGNDFTCLAKSVVDYRPERRTPWPHIGGVVHARVCAASNGSQYAHIDDKGRYKVRFLFDVENEEADKASCWVRKCENYVGKDFGFHAPLLQGFEVLVAFENGDPDRPIIVGSAYNSEFPSPTKNTNHAQSVWRSSGKNEIRFDDTSGSEHVFVHATKDWNNVVENDRTTEIKHDDIQKVTNNRNVNVDVDQKTEIGSNCEITIGANYTEKIGGDKSIEVTGSHTETITADMTLTVSGATTMTYSGDHTITNGAAVVHDVAGDLTKTVGGKEQVSIGGDNAISIGGKYELTAGGAFKQKAASMVSEASGPVKIKAGSIFKAEAAALAQIKGAVFKAQATGMAQIKSGAILKLDSSAGMNLKAGGPLKLKGAVADIMDGSLKVM